MPEDFKDGAHAQNGFRKKDGPGGHPTAEFASASSRVGEESSK